MRRILILTGEDPIGYHYKKNISAGNVDTSLRMKVQNYELIVISSCLALYLAKRRRSGERNYAHTMLLRVHWYLCMLSTRVGIGAIV